MNHYNAFLAAQECAEELLQAHVYSTVSMTADREVRERRAISKLMEVAQELGLHVEKIAPEAAKGAK